MENNTPQPIIVQSSSKKGIVDYIFIAALIGGVGYFGKKMWDEHVSQKESGKLDTPATQAASKIYNAKHWYGNTPQVAFDAAKEIAQKKIPFKDVADAFTKLYTGNINDYLSYLGPQGMEQFYNIINLTSDDTTKFTGKPPVKSTLKYDVINNYSYAVAKIASNIRKSPAIIGNGGITSMIGDSNIVTVAEINKPLGLMTGIYQLSPDGKTGFIEFYGEVIDSSGTMSFKKLWVAGANVKIVTFPKKTQETQAKDYLHNSDWIKIDGSKYDKANS